MIRYALVYINKIQIYKMDKYLNEPKHASLKLI